MVFVFKGVFQHDDGLVDPALLVEWFKERVGTQAFTSSFPAGRLGLVLAATARLVCRVGGLKTELGGFRRGRTRANRLLSAAMKQRSNQALETTSTAVTDRADARSAPSAAVSHL